MVQKFTINDNYRTPKYAWEMLTQFIPQDKVIYEPFYCEGASGEYWTELGYNVIHNNEDFYTHCEERKSQCDIIVSNPPYSNKKPIFEKLKELDKPFIMLVPIEILGYKYFQDHYANQVQVIIPPKRINFIKIKEQDGTIIEEPKQCSFHVIFLCYKMNLEKDLMFIEV